MPRYDKYSGITGGFRAPLFAAISAANKNVAYGVGLDTAGRVVIGAGNTGVLGVMVAHDAKAAGDIVDVMTSGEIVEMAALTAGTVYYINATTGALETAAPGAGVNKTKAGHTVEATRLIVRAEVVQG